MYSHEIQIAKNTPINITEILPNLAEKKEVEILSIFPLKIKEEITNNNFYRLKSSDAVFSLINWCYTNLSNVKTEAENIFSMNLIHVHWKSNGQAYCMTIKSFIKE
jgi:hypothetical protein